MSELQSYAGGLIKVSRTEFVFGSANFDPAEIDSVDIRVNSEARILNNIGLGIAAVAGLMVVMNILSIYPSPVTSRGFLFFGSILLVGVAVLLAKLSELRSTYGIWIGLPTGSVEVFRSRKIASTREIASALREALHQSSS
ncbi:MAG: DUF6232 family protein [Chloroflexota bacterium]